MTTKEKIKYAEWLKLVIEELSSKHYWTFKNDVDFAPIDVIKQLQRDLITKKDGSGILS